MKKLVSPIIIFLVLAAVFSIGALFRVASPVAANAASGRLQSVVVTFYTDQGTMADGQQTHIGACAAFVPQFAFGTELELFNPSDLQNPQFSCTVEDTGGHICQNNIDVALPGQVNRAIQLGAERMQLKVVGFDQNVAQEAAANHAVSQGCSGGATH